MALVSSGTIALQDAGANSGGTNSYYLDDTFTAGSSTGRDLEGGFIEEDENGEEQGFTETIGTYTVYGYNGSSTTTGNTAWRSGQTWDAGTGWDDDDAVEPADNLGALGSGLTAAYMDGSSTLRTIVTAVLAYDSSGTASAPDQFLMLGLAGTSAPNTDNTFKEFKWGGLTVSRAAADHVGTTNGCRIWIWELTAAQRTTAGASTGTKDLEIISGSTSTNNGIAEEFGGADSADVKLSDYYKGASTNYVISGVPTQNIPTSGEIKFSDFYGSSYVAPSGHATALVSGATGGYGFARSGYLISSIGSITDATITSFNGSSTCSITALHSHATSTTATSGTIILRIVNSTGSGATNAGFTILQLWLNQSNDSGSPDTQLFRTSASYSGSGGTMTWTWSVSSSSPTVYNKWFNGSGSNYYMKLV